MLKQHALKAKSHRRQSIRMDAQPQRAHSIFEVAKAVERALVALAEENLVMAKAVKLQLIDELGLELVASRLSMDVSEACELLKQGRERFRILLEKQGVHCR